MKKKYLFFSLLTIIMSFGYVQTNSNSLGKIDFLTITANAADDEEFPDFKDDEHAAEEWTNEQKKLWEKTESQTKVLQDYIDNQNNLATNIESFDLTPIEMVDKSLAENYTSLRETFSKAKLGSGIVCYKYVNTNDFGLVGEITNDNFQNQFVGKNVKLTEYFEANLTDSKLDRDSNLILRLRIPSSEGRDFKPQAGVFEGNSSEIPNILVNNIYNIHIDDSREGVMEGRRVILADCTLKNNIDFKNDFSAAQSWGIDNYKDWAPKEKTKDNQLNTEQINALNGYFNNDYKEINNYLRTEEQGSNPNLEEKIKNITDGLSVRPVPDDVTVYRWMGIAELGYTTIPTLDKLQSDYLGETINNKAFLSTSMYSGSTTFSSPRSLLLRLNVPEGTHGGFPVSSTVSQESMLIVKGGESELLLDKNQNYEIYKITETKVRGKLKFVLDANLIN